MKYANLLKNIWHSIYDSKNDVVETIEKFFHPDYEQTINGVARSMYTQHVIEQTKNITIDHIDYKYIIEKENELFALYYPKGKNKSNHLIEAEVIAYFRFEKCQLLNIHGQVRMIRGDHVDVDMRTT